MARFDLSRATSNGTRRKRASTELGRASEARSWRDGTDEADSASKRARRRGTDETWLAPGDAAPERASAALSRHQLAEQRKNAGSLQWHGRADKADGRPEGRKARRHGWDRIDRVWLCLDQESKHARQEENEPEDLRHLRHRRWTMLLLCRNSSLCIVYDLDKSIYILRQPMIDGWHLLMDDHINGLYMNCRLLAPS